MEVPARRGRGEEEYSYLGNYTEQSLGNPRAALFPYSKQASGKDSLLGRPIVFYRCILTLEKGKW